MNSSGESAFLDLLYGAAAQPDLWVPVMERFADMVGGSGAILSRLDVGDGSGSRLVSRLDSAMSDRYFQHYASRNPLTNVKDRRGYAINWRALILTDEDWIAKEDLVRTEYYSDMMRPQDVHSVLFIRLALNDYKVCVLNICRPEAHGQFGGEDLDVAARFHPHLIRAFDLGQRLSAGRARNEDAVAVFEHSESALFLLDRSARVLRLNRAADKMVRDGHGLGVVAGRLSSNQPEANRKLEALVALAASADPEHRAGGSMALPCPERLLPFSITIAPMRSHSAPVFFDEPSVLVCVTDLEAQVHLPEQNLRDLFGFTPAEIRLAMALFAGASLHEAAAASGVSVNTVRVHLARIFEKTGVNRQGALLSLLNRTVTAGPR
jgi:DNA-binding CsgD family transcriptional regulator